MPRPHYIWQEHQGTPVPTHMLSRLVFWHPKI
jgi:hypothetical protein